MKNLLTLAVLLLVHGLSFADNVNRIRHSAFTITDPHSFCTFNDQLWFGASDGSGVRLFYSNGTAEEMKTNVGTFGHKLANLTVAQGKLYFSSGKQLYYATDEPKVYELSPFFPGLPVVQGFHSFQEYNNYLLFIVSYGNDKELFSLDLGSHAVSRVAALTGKSFSQTSEYTIYNNKIYFPADDGTGNKELWVSDLTSAGTHMVTDIYPTGSSNPSNLTVFNNRLYFSAETETGGAFPYHYKPWSTDGTGTGTQQLKNIFPPGTYPIRFHDLGSKLVFTVQGMLQDYTLYATDGTTAGTDSLVTVYYADQSFVYKGHLYFGAANNMGVRILWRTDGTANGTQVFNNSAADPKTFAVYNDKLYFKATAAGQNAYQIWRTDGSIAQQQLFPAVHISPAHFTDQFHEYHGGLYFNAMYDASGYTLWKLDPFPTIIAPEETGKPVQLYPNPTSGRITLHLPPVLKEAKHVSIRMLTVTGQHAVALYNGTYSPALELALPEVAAGVYLIEVSADGRQVMQERLSVRQ